MRGSAPMDPQLLGHFQFTDSQLLLFPGLSIQQLGPRWQLETHK